MMTPEQMQNTMSFIVENHAQAMIRMDRFDRELKEQKQRVDQLVASVDQHSDLFRMIAEMLAMQQQRLKWLEDKQH
jgi:hypothetical protein